jgi:hypothetical protein
MSSVNAATLAAKHKIEDRIMISKRRTRFLQINTFDKLTWSGDLKRQVRVTGLYTHVLSPHVQMEEPQTRTVVEHRSEGGTLVSLSLERLKRFGESFTEDAGIKSTPRN